jgi:hypothetical protein
MIQSAQKMAEAKGRKAARRRGVGVRGELRVWPPRPWRADLIASGAGRRRDEGTASNAAASNSLQP